MPDLRKETIDISGEFQNFVVTSGIVQKGILENASLLESDLVAYSIYYTHSSTQKAIVISRKFAVFLIVLSHDRGNPLVFTSVLFIAHWLYKMESKVDQLVQFSSVDAQSMEKSN